MITPKDIYQNFAITQEPAQAGSQLAIFKIVEILVEFLKHRASDSKENIQKFILDMRIMFEKGNPELYNRIMSLWVAIHRVPIAKLTVPYEQILQIVPPLNYLDLSNLEMKKLGCEGDDDSRNKFGQILKKCTNVEDLVCPDGIVYEIQTDEDFTVIDNIAMDSSIFCVMSHLEKLKSLDISSSKVDSFSKLPLYFMSKLNKLNIRDIYSEREVSWKDNLSFLSTRLLDLSMPIHTPGSLAKITEYTQLKKLALSF